MLSNDVEDVIEQALSWRAGGRRVALATVIATWGSAPRPLGSQLAVEEGGAFAGSVSGGCIESAVVQAAHEVMASGGARRLEFGVSHEDAWRAGLSCGGRTEVLVEAISDPAPFEGIASDRRARRAIVRATDLGSYAHTLIDPAAPDPALDPELRAAARAAAAQDRSVRLATAAGELFLRVWNPRLRLFVVGAVHVAQPLVRMAELNGFEVAIIDPRSAFATEARFPGATLHRAFPDEVLDGALDRRSAVVTLSHDPKLDEPALEAALRASVFYAGALGSRRTHAARLSRLAARGFTGDQLARIHGPVGLDIGALTASEIATAIMAELIRELRRAVW